MLSLTKLVVCAITTLAAPFPHHFHQQIALENSINLAQVWAQAIQQSESNDSACINRLKSATNYFLSDEVAQHFIEFSGKSINDLGMYSQCVNSNGSIYVLLNVARLLNLGLCMPVECGVEFLDGYKLQIASIIRNISPISLNETSVVFYDVKSDNIKYKKFTAWKKVWLYVLGALIVFCIFCTVYTHGMPELALSCKMHLKLLSCFSLSKNLSTIFYSVNKVDKNLDVINGVKTLSCCWVVTGHSFLFMATLPVTNLSYVIDYISKSALFTIITGATVSVDVFFAIAGFLSALGITQLFYNAKQRNISNVLLLYFKRYIRLLPMYLCLFLLAYCVLPLLGDGPIFSRSYDIGWQNCEENWWMNFLYINNIWHSKECLSWTWYISNDMQYFLITPWLIWLYSYRKLVGFLVVAALFTFSIGSNIYLALHYNIRVSITELGEGLHTYFDKIYLEPYTRINTYLMGIIIAWLYLDNKDAKYAAKPLTYINRALNNRYCRYAVYVCGFVLLNYSMFLYYSFNEDYTKITMLFTALYISLSRAGFVLGLLCIIYPIMIGHGKPLLSVLGHQIFNALSKFTYAIYMLHLLVFAYYMYSTVQGIEFSCVFLLARSGDILVMGALVAIVCTLLFDSPCLNIEKHFLFKHEPKGRKLMDEMEMKVITRNN